MDDLSELEDKLGFRFKDYSLIARALTHRSFLNENPSSVLEDNERLEFLGDAVLDFVVGAYLYHHFPEVDEGELTSLRAALVRTKMLADFAREWNLGRLLQLGHGEADSGGRDRAPILCAAFEAVIGAIYLDQGLDRVKAATESLIGPALEKIMKDSLHKDAKSEFQVWAQARYNITPRYQVVSSSGPDHAKVFTVQAIIGDEIWGEGSGRSKQRAAQEAAGAALVKVESADSAEETPSRLVEERP
jgi:ribonuclease-3